MALKGSELPVGVRAGAAATFLLFTMLFLPSGAAQAQPSQTAAACPDTAPIHQWARQHNLEPPGADSYSDIWCGDFTGDGRPDAVARLHSAESGGNSVPPYDIVLFSNIGGRLRHLRTVSDGTSGLEEMRIFGMDLGEEFPVSITPGRIVLTNETLEANDPRCCPTGITAFTIDTATGRVAQRLVRVRTRAEIEGWQDNVPDQAGTAVLSSNARWEVIRGHEGDITAGVDIELPELIRITIFCSYRSQRLTPGILVNLPTRSRGGHLILGFTGSDGGQVSLDSGWTSSEAVWIIEPRDDHVFALLAGRSSWVDVALDGRPIGRVSLAGSSRAINEALVQCRRPTAAAAAATAAPARTAQASDESQIRTMLNRLYATYENANAPGPDDPRSAAYERERRQASDILTPELKQLEGTLSALNDGLDADPFCECQDSMDISYRVSSVVVQGDTARATVDFSNFGQRVGLFVFSLKRTATGWRVEDMITPRDPGYRATLQREIREARRRGRR